MRSEKLEKIDVKVNELSVQLTFMDIESLNYALDEMDETLGYLKNENNAPRMSKIIKAFHTFIAQQRKCLKSFSSIKDREDIKKIEEISNFCVLMFGPIARLEYVPRKSEVGIFPLVPQKSLEIEFIKEHHQKCQAACSYLEKIIKSTFRELEEDKEIEIYRHVVEFGNKKYCFDEKDLIDSETKHRFLLPDDERACLFGEAVYLIGDSQMAKELRQKVLDTYGCLRDFEEGNFPMLTYIYEQEVVAQGLANALGEIRHKVDHGQCTEDDWNQAKLIFSRFIGIKVKQLALHMLYWIRQRDERDVSFKFFQKGKNIKHLDEILHQPPIYLGIHYLRVLGGRLAIPRKYGQMSFNEWIKTRLKDTTDKSAINTLNDMFEKILNKVDFPRQKESDFSIGKLMLELWYSCYEGNISEQSLKELCDKSWELVEITGQAALISLYLEKIRLQEKSEKDQLNLYDQFWHLVQPAIFPEYRRESIITKGDIAPGISDRILWFFRLF